MNSLITAYWREVANGTRTNTADQLLLALMSPWCLIYSMVQRLRAGFYRIGLYKTRRLPRPVISIGNITVGGTGKTPVTAYIARMLLRQGHRVAVISRGYGGSLEGQNIVVSDGVTVMLSARECGDEPYLLATTVAGLMVVIGADRYAAGKLALEQLDPDIFLLDDGYQHVRLYRNLNILLLDYTHPFGNGWTLPFGILREPVCAVNRADLIIHTRCRADTAGGTIPTEKPFCMARHELGAYLPLSGGESQPLAALHGRTVLAFAGIADPQAFFDELRAYGLNLVETISFPDHVAYDDTLINTIDEKMQTSRADYAITTEKDGVKLIDAPKSLSDKILLARLTLAITDPAPLRELVGNLFQK
jgi:tetraacyldisaccharide 4'-kinase